jgi:hypothetical protein
MKPDHDPGNARDMPVTARPGKSCPPGQSVRSLSIAVPAIRARNQTAASYGYGERVGPIFIGSGAPLRYKTGHSKPAVFPLDAATSARSSTLFDPMMRTSFAGYMRRSALRALLAAVQHARQDLLETLGLQRTLLDVLGHDTDDLFIGRQYRRE